MRLQQCFVWCRSGGFRIRGSDWVAGMAIEDGRDNYDEDLCKSIGKAIEKFGNALDYYDSLTQVVVYLDGLAEAYNSRAPLDMATAITDAQTRFQQALGVCVDNLETIHWIMEQIQNIFCNEGE
jgi:hypothetical protein